MALIVEKGYDFKIKLGENVFGCARTVTFGGSRERQDASCVASGDVLESVPGRKSYTLSAESLIRVATLTDIGTNVTTATIEAAFESGEIMDFEFGTDTIGATKKVGKAWIESFEESGSFDGEPTFSVTFAVTGEVTYEVNAA